MKAIISLALFFTMFYANLGNANPNIYRELAKMKEDIELLKHKNTILEANNTLLLNQLQTQGENMAALNKFVSEIVTADREKLGEVSEQLQRYPLPVIFNRTELILEILDKNGLLSQ